MDGVEVALQVGWKWIWWQEVGGRLLLAGGHVGPFLALVAMLPEHQRVVVTGQQGYMCFHFYRWF